MSSSSVSGRGAGVSAGVLGPVRTLAPLRADAERGRVRGWEVGRATSGFCSSRRVGERVRRKRRARRKKRMRAATRSALSTRTGERVVAPCSIVMLEQE